MSKIFIRRINFSEESSHSRKAAHGQKSKSTLQVKRLLPEIQFLIITSDLSVPEREKNRPVSLRDFTTIEESLGQAPCTPSHSGT